MANWRYENMNRGEKYLVKYRIKGVHKKDHSFVGRFLGINTQTGEYTFDLRPSSGTSNLNPSSIIDYQLSSQPCGIKS